MRIDEIFGDATEAPTDRNERLTLLKHQIELNEKPRIAAATFSRGRFGWGDLEALGWAKRHSIPISRRQALVEVWWEYTGPNSVMVEPYLGKAPVEMSTGDTTDPIEVDYS